MLKNLEPTNGSKVLAIKHKQQDELTIKKLDPKHKQLLKDCFQYSAIFKEANAANEDGRRKEF